jgi:hypothetical protein
MDRAKVANGSSRILAAWLAIIGAGSGTGSGSVAARAADVLVEAGSSIKYLANSADPGVGDAFLFAYSTDDASYTDMVTVTKTADDDTCQTFSLPSSLSGTVFIRVLDSDQTQGNSALDTVFVDHLFIQSE